MSLIQITFPTITPLFVQRVTLDGTDYFLTFDWHARVSRWYMYLRDIDGNALAGAQKILCRTDIFRHQKWNPAMPKGTFFAVDTLGADAPPLYGDLGTRVLLVYGSDV